MKSKTELDQKVLSDLQDRLQPSSRQRARQQAKLILWRISRNTGGLVKRLLDITVSVLALIVAMPFLLVVALLIKLTDFGPVIFWQVRIGKWGRPFPFPKFRSMVINAEALKIKLADANAHGEGITFKMKKDPRITWIGRFIRKTSIDELPQLWCVLKGDMSLVGPRPALVSEVARYTLEDRRRLDATPGLTCTWQVSGRSNIPFQEQCRLDVDYIEQQSIYADLKLLLRTIPAVITGRGAY